MAKVWGILKFKITDIGIFLHLLLILVFWFWSLGVRSGRYNPREVRKSLNVWRKPGDKLAKKSLGCGANVVWGILPEMTTPFKNGCSLGLHFNSPLRKTTRPQFVAKIPPTFVVSPSKYSNVFAIDLLTLFPRSRPHRRSRLVLRRRKNDFKSV